MRQIDDNIPGSGFGTRDFLKFHFSRSGEDNGLGFHDLGDEREATNVRNEPLPGQSEARHSRNIHKFSRDIAEFESQRSDFSLRSIICN